MSTTVNTGWLKDKNGDKFAPKTLSSQVMTSEGVALESKINSDLAVLDSSKADLNHNHNNIYYDKTEIDSKLDVKQATINGAATTITSNNLTASRALISDGSGKVAVSAVSSTELGYLDGVTSNIQTQLDAKVPTSRTVNGKALSADITLSASDVGAAASSHTHSSYVNQNAFSNVKVGSTTVAADTTTDTLEIAAGTGISVAGDATNDKVTITNSGVRSIATGTSNGTISVNTNGTSANVAVKGLGSAAYTASTAYDAAGTATTKADAALASAKSYTDEKIDALVGEGASETLDTIGEISAAIEEHQDVTDALNAAIGNKVDKVSGKGLSTNDYTTAEKDKLAGIATGANAYTLPTASSSTLGGVKTTSTVTSTSGLTACPIISGVPYYKDTNTTYSLSSFGVTATAAELNYTDGVTSNIQTQLDGKAASSHSHSAATTSAAGFMSASDKSKLDGITASADSVSFTQSLTSGTQVGTITINGTGTALYAPTNTDTHYTTGLKVGASASATSNAAATNGNVYLNVLDNTTVRDSHKIVGSGATTVTSDANGVITISSTDNNTVYTHPTYTARTGKPTANQTPAFGGTATVSQITSDATGHVTGATDRTITIPSTLSNGTGTAGLIKTSSTVTSNSGYTACPVISGVPYYKDTNTTYTLSSITGTLAVSKGGTGATTASDAMTNLAASGITSGGSIKSDTAFTDNLGSSSIPWYDTYSKSFTVVGEVDKTYGQLYRYTTGTTSTKGKTYLDLGNSTASGTAGNASGVIRLFGESSGYTILQPSYNNTSHITVSLPSAGGTLALKTDITDTKVTQTVITTNGNFPLLLRGTSAGTTTTTTTTSFGTALLANPSTGQLRVTSLNIGDGAVLAWDSSDSSVTISFL